MCGIAGASCIDLSAATLVLGMLEMQTNRGDDAAGIAISGGCEPNELRVVKGQGSPEEVFSERMRTLLLGRASIGHVRYPTSAGSGEAGAHPFHVGDIALAHNGNITNVDDLQGMLVPGTEKEMEFGSDTEYVAALLAQAKGTLHERITSVCTKLEGSYSLCILQSGGVVAYVRDPHGIRPLYTGHIEIDGRTAFLAASETCAIESVGGTVDGEVEPGEVVYVHPDGTVQRERFAPADPDNCIFEFIYFQRAFSKFRGVTCLDFRKALGAQLAREVGLLPDSDARVVPVLNSGLGGALGLYRESGIEYDPFLINVGKRRTFLQPLQSMRVASVWSKHVPCRTEPGLRLLVVDDSIVRGTTIGPVVEVLRRNNPSSVEVFIPCPMFYCRCNLGIDTPTNEELIAHRLKGDVEAIRKEIGADKLHFLSLEGLDEVIRSFGWDPEDFCKACFDGNYPAH